MYLYKILAPFLTMLCRVFGVTPDDIKVAKDESLPLTAKDAAVRVKGLIAS